MLKIIDALIKTQISTGNHAITVMCKYAQIHVPCSLYLAVEAVEVYKYIWPCPQATLPPEEWPGDEAKVNIIFYSWLLLWFLSSCSDGVGRTGTFICIYSQLERIKAEGIADVFQYIKASRLQRPKLVSEVVSSCSGYTCLSTAQDTK